MKGTSRELDWAFSLSDAVVFAFALFTLVHNVVYASNGSLAAVVVTFSAVSLGLYAASRRLRVSVRSSGDDDSLRATPSAFDGSAPLPIVLGALAAVGFLDPYWLSTPEVRANVAIAASIVAGLLVWRQARQAPAYAGADRARSVMPHADDALVAIAMVGGALLSACVLRPDADDAAYYGHVAHAAAHPFEPMPHFYAIVGPGQAPFPYLSYPLMSLHDLVAAFAAIAGCDPVDVAGAVLAPIGGALIALAYGVAARVLAGERFRIVFAMAMLFLLLDGTARAAYGDFAFIRIWQGKSVLLHFLVPLLVAAAVRFGERPGLLGAARLVALLVASTGTSSIAIWLGPLVAGIGTLAGILASGGKWRYALSVPLLAAYPLFLGVITLQEVMSRVDLAGATGGGAPSTGTGAPIVDAAFAKVLGPVIEQRILLGASVLAAFVGPTRRLRALAAVSCFVVLGLLTHQAIGPAFSRYVTSPAIYWRVFWALPVPLLVGAAVAWAHALPRGLPRAAGLALSFAAAVGALVEIPETTTLARSNATRFAPPPHAQLEPVNEEVVRAIVQRANPRDMIVAPRGLAVVLSVRSDAPPPYLPRENMSGVVARSDWGGRAEAERRLYGLEYTTGRRPFRRDILDAIAADRNVQAFVVRPNALGRERLHELLLPHGFQRGDDLGPYLVWWRTNSTESPGLERGDARRAR